MCYTRRNMATDKICCFEHCSNLFRLSSEASFFFSARLGLASCTVRKFFQPSDLFSSDVVTPPSMHGVLSCGWVLYCLGSFVFFLSVFEIPRKELIFFRNGLFLYESIYIRLYYIATFPQLSKTLPDSIGGEFLQVRLMQSAAENAYVIVYFSL